MAVLTENSLRSQFFKKELNESILKLPKGTILTPSAKSYLNDKRISVEFVEQDNAINNHLNEKQHDGNGSFLNNRLKKSGSTELKAEYMTFLDSNKVVYKDHERIILRGKLDSLQSKIMEGQITLADNRKLVEDLSNILDFVRSIVQSEVTGEPLGDFQLLGMSEKEIQKMAHHPKQYFGIDHFIPDYKMGKEIIVLNTLRTFIRDTEISVYQSFKKDDGSMERNDMMLALNRLSSLCLVMMLRCKIGYYSLEEEG